jgi:hypothetical protein
MTFTCRRQYSADQERGVALFVTILAMLLLSAIGGSLVLSTISETAIAANFLGGRDVFYAADAGLERALADLAEAADWSAVLGGTASSTFTDGAPTGTRRLGSGTVVDIGRTMNLANCGRTSACSSADMDAVTSVRPWGANNPRWTPYLYGPLRDLLPPSSGPTGAYVVVFASDDPAETDGEPYTDATDPASAGHGVIALRAEAFGPRHAHCTIQLTAARAGPSVRVLSWATLP